LILNKKIEKKWIVFPRIKNDLIDQILLNRNILDVDASTFMSPSFDKGLHNPFLLSGMEEATQRIELAIKRNEPIGIFADYDADGIPASVVLSEVLEKHGLKVFVYIPSRKDGYGLNHKGVDYLNKLGVKLIITVDLGIREIDNTQYINSLGIDVIITDHHEPGEKIPKALAVVDPKLADSKYPFRELSGGGVVFKLAQALSKKLGILNSTDLKWLLDLVAITTICDVVPLIDENRIFAKFGLTVLSKTKRLGLKKLYEISNISPDNISTYTVGFQIGPRLNAPGRLNGENESFFLLKSTQSEEATKLALELDRINARRQSELEVILNQAVEQIEAEKLYDNKIIFLYNKNWQSGLIGLVAGKLVELYSRPCFVLEQGDVFSKGSVRSIDNFNIVKVLEESNEFLENFGGHAKAAGLTIKNENLPKLFKKVLEIADRILVKDDLLPKIMIDAELQSEDINFDLVEDLKKLEPFGLANSKPIFMMSKIVAKNPKTIGQDNKHLKFSIGSFDAIAFGFADFLQNTIEQEIDIVFNLEENIWNNTKKIQFKILDIKLNHKEAI